ncbi:MAG TPA: peptidylprolyl isomerase [Actinomycetota bacterium]|nr:peptidylprolyl isomerase [Actinomycetota bacterium]
MPKNARSRQLRKLAERRAAERRRRRRQRIVAGSVAGLLVLGGGGAAALALLGGGDERPAPEPSPPEQAETPEATVACGASVPPGADRERPSFDRAPRMRLDRDADYRAVMRTSCGTVELDLFEDETPVTVNNFVFLAGEGFYDGLTFHRVIDGFMIQGGDPAGDGTGGPGYQFEDEIVKRLRFDRSGLLAMANSGPDTNGSQFFITVGEPTHLNGRHTIFGEVTGGMDVVRQINALSTDAQDRPTETVYVEKITIEER